MGQYWRYINIGSDNGMMLPRNNLLHYWILTVFHYNKCHQLTHWGRGTHICVSNLTIIDLDNGLLSGQRQAIIWTNAGILFIGPLGTNFSEILIKILTFSFKIMYLKVSSGKWRPFCLGLNVLMSITSCKTLTAISSKICSEVIYETFEFCGKMICKYLYHVNKYIYPNLYESGIICAEELIPIKSK